MIKGAFNKLGQIVSETFDFNKATLSGCIDIIVTEQPDGSLKSSKFHIRFGKFKVLKTKEKQVTIHVNGVEQQYQMKIETEGQCYFEEVREIKDLKKLSEDFNPSDQEYDNQSPSEDEDIGIISRDELSTQEQLDMEDKQYKELQKMEQILFKEGKLSPKDSKGLMHSFKSIFKASKQHQQQQQQQMENMSGNNSPLKKNNDLLTSDKKNLNQDEINKEQVKTDINNIQEKQNLQQVQNQKQNQQTDEQQQQLKDVKTKNIQKIDQKTPEKQQQQQGYKEDLELQQQNLQCKKENVSEKKQEVQQQQLQKIQKQDNNEETRLGEQDEEDDEEEVYEDEDENAIELSLCANLINKSNENDASEIFEQKKITYEEFIKDPIKILSNKNLLVRIKNQLYPYDLAIAILICNQAFKQDLPLEQKRQILKKKEGGFFSKLFSSNANKTNSEQKQQVIKQENETKSQIDQNSNKKKIISEKQFLDENNSVIKHQDEQKSSKTLKDKQIQQLKQQGYQSEDNFNYKDNNDLNNNTYKENLHELNQEVIKNLTEDKSKSRKVSEDQISLKSDSSFQKSRIKKTIKPKTQILESFQLKPGKNEISFTVKTELGEQTERCHIFLYQRNEQIVISDIDGTITKSDVLGQLMPMVGKEWSHEGVADLYNSISQNGYQILYLTARAIGQSDQTRGFIKSLQQQGIKLPDGPIIMSPDRVITSFTREVIHKKPEIFKIMALRDIASLFQSQSPFFAGFGNRDTDAIAYKAAGVSMGRIFIINPDGQLFQFQNNTYNKTYKELDEIVQLMFPAIDESKELVEERFNDFNYWHQQNMYSNNVDIDLLFN